MARETKAQRLEREVAERLVQQAERKKKEVQVALNKLTPKERELLGLKNT